MYNMYNVLIFSKMYNNNNNPRIKKTSLKQFHITWHVPSASFNRQVKNKNARKQGV